MHFFKEHFVVHFQQISGLLYEGKQHQKYNNNLTFIIKYLSAQVYVCEELVDVDEKM